MTLPPTQKRTQNEQSAGKWGHLKRSCILQQTLTCMSHLFLLACFQITFAHSEGLSIFLPISASSSSLSEIPPNLLIKSGHDKRGAANERKWERKGFVKCIMDLGHRQMDKWEEIESGTDGNQTA